ncbi:hypothetical protein [Flavobacterium sp.]|uniref:tetratricopeptide repeat protein n=1 Tax=Flavobacterium sp. TaxID=239 RepID=UPI001226EC26|nr:hypothetical protein [Flavobacterium sp.]RZJ70028.1 MAG: hypothetical protein EOO49_15350 [Flavobacterium sp.]
MGKWFLFAFFLLPILALAQSDLEKARESFAQKLYPEAKKYYLTLYRSDANDAETVERLGDVCSYSKNWEEASVYYRKLIKLRPKSAQANYKYGGALAMQASESKWKALGLLDDIEQAFEKTIALDPKHVEARWALVEFYLQLPGILGGSESKANKYADDLARLSPVDHYLAKGRIAEYFNRLEAAEKYYLKAHAIGNSETTLKKLKSVRKKMSD